MHNQGMKFESHSLTHPYLLSLTDDELNKELQKSKEEIEKITKSKVAHFSVPYGFYNKRLADCIRDAGYSSLVTEDIGYYRNKLESFHILPRFTVKSKMQLKADR